MLTFPFRRCFFSFPLSENNLVDYYVWLFSFDFPYTPL